MRRSSPWVRWGKALVPRFLAEPPLNPPPGSCTRCGGLGEVVETIDDELPDEMMPCFMCQQFCRACNKYVKKTGHQCVTPVPEAQP